MAAQFDKNMSHFWKKSESVIDSEINDHPGVTFSEVLLSLSRWTVKSDLITGPFLLLYASNIHQYNSKLQQSLNQPIICI